MVAAKTSRGAAFSRGASKQDYSTPGDFIVAVKAKFEIVLFNTDLAASSENAKSFHYFTEIQNSLEEDWTKLRGNLWLNPPFGDIAPWAQKCARESDDGRTRCIYLLVPASVGSNWYAQHVHERACVYFLNGRLRFDGHKDDYPKDLLLAVYGRVRGHHIWSWKKGKRPS